MKQIYVLRSFQMRHRIMKSLFACQFFCLFLFFFFAFVFFLKKKYKSSLLIGLRHFNKKFAARLLISLAISACVCTCACVCISWPLATTLLRRYHVALSFNKPECNGARIQGMGKQVRRRSYHIELG